ncbi:MAG: MFS transporter [Mycobacteriales bacterium]
MTARPDPRRWYALALLCTAAFMVILDASSVVIAVPSIAAHLHFGDGSVQWVLTAYVVTFGGLLLFGGRAGDLLGRRRTFMVSVGLFASSSLLCGLAWSAGTLVAFRAVQGVAAAVMTPTALSLVLTTFTEVAERNRAIGVWSAVSGIGATAGSLVGGPLTDGPGWQWIFFINVPVGALLLALTPVLLRESRGGGRRQGFDAAGATTVTAALMALIYAVSEAPRHGWAGGRTLAALAASALLVAVFAVIESRSATPLVPLGALRSAALVGGSLICLLCGMCAFGQGFTLTEYTQQVLGWSAARYGLMTVILPVMAVIGSMASQHLVTRWNPRIVAAPSMALMGAGALCWLALPAHGSAAALYPGLLFFGAGLGAGGVAGSIAAVAGMPAEQSGLVSGLTNAAFQIGGALGVAVLSSVAVSRTDRVAAAGQHDRLAALTAGSHAAFAGAIVFALVGIAVSALLLRRRRPAPEPSGVTSSSLLRPVNSS